jgi:hypothetical protein
LLRYRHTFELSDAEAVYLRYRDDRTEFDEWIARIRLSSHVHDLPRAEAATLADLVDFAIDADVGVVEDPATEEYYVTHGEMLYVFEPPPVPHESGETEDVAPDERDGVPVDSDTKSSSTND